MPYEIMCLLDLVSLGVYLASLAPPKPLGAELPYGAELHEIER